MKKKIELTLFIFTESFLFALWCLMKMVFIKLANVYRHYHGTKEIYNNFTLVIPQLNFKYKVNDYIKRVGCF